MNGLPKISVLMPVYNAQRYLAEAVESILNQTFTDFEFLIINDGSTDRSLDILQHYARQDDRIRLTSRPNTGHVKALNEMLAQAKGDLIARMDADDIALPDRFAQQVNFLDRHPEVVCVGGAHAIMDDAGRLLTWLKLPTTDQEIQQKVLAGHGSICHPCAMIRREALWAIGGYDETLMPAEDIDLWLKLGEIGKLANLDQPILRYRVHTNSVSEKSCARQRQNGRIACERAWKRRGIEGTFEAGEMWRPGPDRKSRHKFMLKYGWWAFNSGQRQTAIHYALQALRYNFLSWESWQLLYCGLFKPMPT